MVKPFLLGGGGVSEGTVLRVLWKVLVCLGASCATPELGSHRPHGQLGSPVSVCGPWVPLLPHACLLFFPVVLACLHWTGLAALGHRHTFPWEQMASLMSQCKFLG